MGLICLTCTKGGHQEFGQCQAGKHTVDIASLHAFEELPHLLIESRVALQKINQNRRIKRNAATRWNLQSQRARSFLRPPAYPRQSSSLHASRAAEKENAA